MINSFKTLDAYKQFDVRMKVMSFFYSKPSIETTIESKPFKDLGLITDDYEDLPEKEKKKLCFNYAGDN